MYYLYTIELLKNDITKFASKWLQLEKIILYEVTQIQKTKYGTFSFISVY